MWRAENVRMPLAHAREPNWRGMSSVTLIISPISSARWCASGCRMSGHHVDVCRTSRRRGSPSACSIVILPSTRREISRRRRSSLLIKR